MNLFATPFYSRRKMSLLTFITMTNNIIQRFFFIRWLKRVFLSGQTSSPWPWQVQGHLCSLYINTMWGIMKRKLLFVWKVSNETFFNYLNNVQYLCVLILNCIPEPVIKCYILYRDSKSLKASFNYFNKLFKKIKWVCTSVSENAP